ncbi:trafficking protein particle complex subunit 6A isoform X11 [Physeter macrocephalus]|uniref:Trafficking protein particle complex subunit 6A isoform X11 n=1 Tax=Physeter macrocephalus TaxID=9755 RepID=A0A9W2W842_PHYMC|nr:trafficking protein particle complex subunit 6A isoform X11 [Physeter catodon]
MADAALFEFLHTEMVAELWAQDPDPGPGIPNIMSLQALPARPALLCWKKAESARQCHQQEAVSFPRPGSRRRSTEWRDRACISCSPAEQRASTRAASAPTSLRLGASPQRASALATSLGQGQLGGVGPAAHPPATCRSQSCSGPKDSPAAEGASGSRDRTPLCLVSRPSWYF